MDSESIKEPFQNPRGKLRLAEYQLEIIKRCSEKGNVSEWNSWRKKHPNVRVYLEGADLRYLRLQKINFRAACLTNAHLEGTDLFRANLEGAWLQTAFTDSNTSFWKVHINRHSKKALGTNMRGIGLESVRIDPGTKQLVEYNIRKLSWEEWYKTGNRLTRLYKAALVRAFWQLSDYGHSTTRIIISFFSIAIMFAVIYRVFPNLLMTNCISGSIKTFLTDFYFSITTMTTLGFGDIHANPYSAIGQIFIIVQVLSGYFILGALITRLNIIFIAGGPARVFSK